MKTKKTLWMLIAIAISIIGCSSLSSCSKEDSDSPVIPPVEMTKPYVQTTSAQLNGNYDSVLVSGKIISDGNSKITACGIKYSCEGGNKTVEISPKDSGTFTVKVPIKFGVIYSFIAYAKNNVGIGYGSTICYSYRASAPAISMTSVTEITETSGVAMDTIDGSNLPTKVTILYGKTASYTDSVVIDTVSKVTIFKFLLRNLEAGSEFHFRFKAENILGKVYTGDKLFCTSIKDIDGNLYPVIKIGSQLWIAKNLTVTHYNDGSPIANPTADADWLAAGSAKTGAYCYYNNDESIGKTYGALYNWYSINTGKLAPKGWHVPTYDEWIEMIRAANRSYDNRTNGYLKETGFDHWKSPNAGATNESGFTAIPSGERAENKNYVFGFLDLHLTASWWTADEWVDGYTRIMYMDYDKTDVFNDQCPKNIYGIAVRIIKDSK